MPDLGLHMTSFHDAIRHALRKLPSVLFLVTTLLGAQRSVIVDADTGNEVDDLFALAHILLDPTVEISALNAAHWQTSHWTEARSMENSHRLNQQLLGEMGLSVRTFRGGAARMYDWGDRARHSAAAYEIIRQAGERDSLEVLVLGALTNVASAVFIAPEIASKLRIYWLGTSMDFDRQVLKRNDFNALMDPFALDYLLESEAALFIMPVNTASAMEIRFSDLQEAIGSHPLGGYLLRRWTDHLDGSRVSRTLWDLALVDAFLRPKVATLQKIQTSRDSGNRPIQYFRDIDAAEIYREFFRRVQAFQRP